MVKRLSDGNTTPSSNLRHFTNRVSELETLRQQLNVPIGYTLPVIMFYGVGGAGKSWLLKRSSEELGKSNIPHARLNFDHLIGGTSYHADPAVALAEIRRQFKVDCPTFDLAMAMLCFKQGKTDEPMFKGGGVGQTCWEIVLEGTDAATDSIPGGNFISWIAGKVGSAAWEKIKDSRAGEWLVSKVGNEDFISLKKLTAQEIYPELSQRLLKDLDDYLPPRNGMGCRGAILLDTFEAMQAASTGQAQQHYKEDWIRELFAPDSPLLLVIAGRDRLTWEIADADFANEKYLKQILVGGLSEKDARELIAKYGIGDPELQQAILRVSRDVEQRPDSEHERTYHAFCLGLACDAVSAAEKKGLKLGSSDFSMSPGDINALVQRFSRSLLRREDAIWITRLAATPRFDAEAAKAAWSSTRGVDRDAAWEMLKTYSFLRPLDQDGWWSLHARMRQALHNQLVEKPESHTEVHTFWKEHWLNRKSLKDADELVWFHSYSLEPEESLKQWDELVEKARQEGQMMEQYRLISWWAATGIDTALITEHSAKAMMQIGREMTQSTLGRQTDNLHQAITYFQSAKIFFTREAHPSEWARLQNNLGAAHWFLPDGDRAENLRKAIIFYQSALEVHTREAYPDHWAGTQNNLGGTYVRLPDGDRAENLRKAVSCYQAALAVYTREAYPSDWAWTQNNLAEAYVNLLDGDRAENLRKAISCCEAALEVHTRDAYPRDWSIAQSNLGHAYFQSPDGDRTGNLRKAIACYQAALEVYAHVLHHADWAATQNNLGMAYSGLLEGDHSENLRKAIVCFKKALDVYNPVTYPNDWAKVQNSLETAQRRLTELSEDAAKF